MIVRTQNIFSPLPLISFFPNPLFPVLSAAGCHPGCDLLRDFSIRGVLFPGCWIVLQEQHFIILSAAGCHPGSDLLRHFSIRGDNFPGSAVYCTVA